MRRLLSILLVLLLAKPYAHAQHHAPYPGDMTTLFRLKPGTPIEVDSLASNQYADLDERCHLLSVDASTLTCAADDDRRVRLTFPIAKVQAIYQVHRKVNVGAILGLAILGVVIGGLATACAPAIALGLIGAIVAGAIAMADDEQRAWRYVWGIPSPPSPAPDRLTLVYQR